MKNIIRIAIFALALCACHGHNHENETGTHEHPVHSATKYSSSIELFVQYDELVAGHTASAVAYITSLPSFKPYEGGAIDVALRAGGNDISLVVEPRHKGVYSFSLSPTEAAVGNLVFTVDGQEFPVHVHVGCGHSHAEGEHAAHTHEHAHEHAHEGHSHDGEHAEEATGNMVAFSKEQSWKIDFATAVIKESHFGGAVKVAAKVAAVPSNFTTVVAATNGKVQFVGNVVEGKAVAAGEPLFYLEGGDVTDNDAAVKFAEAESNYLLAKADYERKKLLFDEMVVSEREFQSAEALFKQAEARFVSMKRSFGDGKVVLKAAKAGYIASLLVANGDYVEPGTPIATIQSDGNVNIAAELPVRFAQQLQNIEDVNIVLPSGEAFSMNALGGSVVAVGSSANSCNMLPVTITAAAIDGVVPGSIVTLYIVSKSSGHAVAVPRTALVEEMGNFFVFVQNNPISFEKRAVEVGSTDGMRVEIAKGLDAGERVVTKGAVALKLSQGAAALDPHAGHVH